MSTFEGTSLSLHELTQGYADFSEPYFPEVLQCYLIFAFLVYLFWSCCVICEFLGPQPGIKPVPPALETQSSNHWTARGWPTMIFN